MTGWEELVTAALLGTDRRAVPELPDGAVAELVGRLDARSPGRQPDPAGRLLDIAGARRAYVLAGRRPSARPAPAAAPPDPEPLASPAAHALLPRLVGEPRLLAI